MTPPNNLEERRHDVTVLLDDARTRLSVLETQRSSDREDVLEFRKSLTTLSEKIDKVHLAVSNYRTERNTLAAVAGIAGAFVTWLGKGVVAFMMSAR